MTGMDNEAGALLDAFEASWPAETVETKAGWRLRAALGAGRRVNSARQLAADAPLNFDDLEMIEAFYAAQALPASIQIAGAPNEQTLFEPDAGVAAALQARGYAPEGEAVLFEAAADAIAEQARRRGPVVIEARAPLAALDFHWSAGGVGPERRAVMARRDADHATIFVAREGAHFAGAVFASRAGERVFAHALHVGERSRRKGVGAALLAAAAAYGRRAGADRLTAATLQHNEGAHHLMRALGMEPVLAYGYFTKPIEAAA